MTVKQRETANKGLPRPWERAMAVVTEEQREEWEEGMPPESTNARRSHFPVLYLLVKILANWAANQPQKPMQKT